MQTGLFNNYRRNLPMTTTTAVSAATTCMACESAACAAANSTAACYRSAAPAGCNSTTYSAGISATRIATASIAVSAASVSVPTAAPAMSPTPAAPRSDTKKDAAVKPSRPVVPVRCAGVRVIRVVAPLARRRTINCRCVINRRANAHPDSHLGICRSRSERQCQNHCKQN